MAYTAVAEGGNYAVYQDGQRVSTTAAGGLSQFGLSPTSLGGGTATTGSTPTATPTTTSQTQAIANVGTAFSTAPTGLTPAQTAAYTQVQQAFAPTAIPVSSLNSTPTALNPVTPPTSTPYPVSSLNNTPAPTTPTLTPEQQKVQDLINTTLGLNNSTVGESAYRSQIEGQQNIPALTTSLNDYNSRLLTLQKEAAAIDPRLRQGAADAGITMPVLNERETVAMRANSIEALGVAALADTARGNLSSAQANVDRLVAEKYGPIKEQIAANMANLNLIQNSPQYTLEERKQAADMLATQEARLKTIANQEQNTKEIWNITTTAAQNGQGFTPSGVYQTLSQTLDAISKAQTKEQALQIASATGLIAPSSSSKPTILGSATGGYYTYDPITGATTPINSPFGGTGGGGTGTGGTGGTSTYQAGQLTTLLQSQGKTADDATLKSLWSQYGSGGTYTNDKAHNAVIYDAMTGGGATTTPIKLSAGQQESIVNINTMTQLANNALQLGEQIGWSGVGGLYTGSLSQFFAKNFGAGSTESQDLRSLIGNIQATIAKERGGTSFTESEKKLLETYSPTINESPLVIQSKLNGLINFLNLKKQSTLGVASGNYNTQQSSLPDYQSYLQLIGQ